MATRSDSLPDKKRPRTDSDRVGGVTPDAKVFVNHPTLYFEDGNVIIKCKNTLFRVHRSLLSKNSPVFEELLTPVADRQERFRGCFLLTVDDDKDDMEALINTVYDGFHINFSTLTVENFPTLAGLLRLVTKYRIERPRKAILDRLREEWPSTLEKHDAKVAAFAERLKAGVSLQANRAQPVLDDIIVHPASVISLLRECNYTSSDLLGPLFYDLSTRTWQFGGPATGHHLAPLSAAEVERFVVGLNQLRCLHTLRAQCPLNLTEHEPCRSRLAIEWINKAYPVLHRSANYMCQPVEDWASLIAIIRNGPRLVCAICHPPLLRFVEESRKQIWDLLQKVFA